MSVTVNISIPLDTATPAIAAKVAQCSPRRLADIVSTPLVTFFRVRLRDLGTNKRGWPSTHFWERGSRAVNSESEEGTSVQVGDGNVTLTVNKIGVRQRWLGGTIKPVNARALTIPISPVSYGHRASEFSGLFLLKTKKGAYLVQPGEQVSEKTGRTGKRRGGGNEKSRKRAALNFLFKLVGSVDQAPNPDVVPSDDEFLEVGMSAIERRLN